MEDEIIKNISDKMSDLEWAGTDIVKRSLRSIVNYFIFSLDKLSEESKDDELIQESISSILTKYALCLYY